MTHGHSVSIREVKKICRKAKKDPMWISNVLWRPVSCYVTWVYLRLGIRAAAVTSLSAAFAVAASLVLLLPVEGRYLTSVVLLQAYLLLDDVDGEVARYELHVGRKRRGDHSGEYWDRLVHYLQGPSFYFCLGFSLYSETADLIWLLSGLVAGMGSGGFPRAVAGHVALARVVSGKDEWVAPVAERYLLTHIGHWGMDGATPPFFLVPRSRSEIIYAAKQFFSFPGNLFIYSVVVFGNAIVAGLQGHAGIMVFLVAYAALHLLNMFVTGWKYFDLLKGPRGT